MRKFFAFILAIVFAFLVFTGVLLYKGGYDFKEVDLNDIKGVWADLMPNGDKIDEIKITEVNIPEPEPEENLSYDERIEKGDYYFERGFLTFASNEYVKAANLEPKRLEPYIKLLKTNYELGDYKKAQLNAEVILKMNPNHYETKYDLALIYIKQSQFANAQVLLDQLALLNTSDARVTYYNGLLQIAFDNHDEGKKILRQAKAESTDNTLDAKIDTLLSAYTEYEFAKAADELYLSELLARAYNKVEEYEMAIYKLKNILKSRNDLRDAWVLSGFAYLNLESYYFALSAFEKAYELDSEWPTTQYFLGLTYAELGNKDDAIIYFNYALANNFEPALVIHQKLADLYLETQDYTKAVDAYKNVLDLNNQNINSFVRPIWIYIDYLNKPSEALKIAKMASASFPESAMSYNLLGWSQTGTQDYKNAEANLKKAIELDPNLAAAYYNLGRLYEAQKKIDIALNTYQKAYELDQNGSIGNLAAKAYNTLMTQ